MYIEGHTFVDALYMTFITISTVGYGTLHELSQGGKLFVVALIILSAGTFIYALTIITQFVIEGEFQLIFKQIRVNKEIKNMEGHVVLCGLGRNGREAALELIAQNKPFVAIEKDNNAVQRFLESHPEALVLVGDGTSDDLLRMANIEKAGSVITSLAEDADNVFVTLTAKEINPAIKVIARANYETSVSKLRRAGADRVILPALISGRKMAKLVTMPGLVDFAELITGEGESQMLLEEIQVNSAPILLNQTLQTLGIRAKTGVMVLGVQNLKGKLELNPDLARTLVGGDKLFILGTKAQVIAFKNLFLD